MQGPGDHSQANDFGIEALQRRLHLQTEAGDNA